MRSGEARPIWIWSKLSVFAIWLVNLVRSFIVQFPGKGVIKCEKKGAGGSRSADARTPVIPPPSGRC